LASLPSGVWRRHDVLAAAKPFFDKERAAEEQKISTALAKYGVDWTDGAGPAGAPKLTTTVSTNKVGNRVEAGDTLVIKAAVRNDGQAPAKQLRARVKSDYFLFDERELVFGKIGPGETKTAELPVKVPKDALTQIDELKLELIEAHGAKVDSPEMKVQIEGLPRPVFAYTYQVIDDIQGNGDGLIQKGEHVRVLVTVKNLGPGKSYRTQTTLKNSSGPGVFIHKGRFRIDKMSPGQTRQVAFDLEVLPELTEDTVQVELAVGDQTLHEYINEKLKFPVAGAQKTVQPASAGVVVLKDRTELRAAPTADATVVGYANKNAAFRVTGRTADFYRVEIEANRPAFVATQLVRSGAAPTTSASFAPTWMVSPPVLAVQTPALETPEGKVHLHGIVKDDHKVSDIYVVVQNRAAKVDLKKVFYRSNRNSKDATKMDFDADVPLWRGENYIHIVARENPQVQSRQTLVVLRTGPTAVAHPASTEKLPLNPDFPADKGPAR
jgi:carboxyl-terminal processing protease